LGRTRAIADDRPRKPSPDRPAPPDPPRLALLAIAVPLAAALALAAFAWPAANAEPRHVPLGVAGPAAAADPLAQRLARQGDAFDVRRYADARPVRAAIEDREVDAAVIAAPGGGRPALLLASAASPTLAQLLPAAVGAAVPVGAVRDVVPADRDDPRGAAFGAAVLPLILAGMLSGALMSTRAPAGAARAAGIAASAVLAGLAAVAVGEGWLGVIPGPWPAYAAALALTVLAIASLVAGLTGLLGQAGIGIAAALAVFVGNPWSGMTSAPELLPEPAATAGQLLPPGAGGSLLRSTAFFHGAGAAGHVAVLAAWALAGLALTGAAALRHRRTGSPAPADDPLVPV
jgi:hypothetical protein